MPEIADEVWAHLRHLGTRRHRLIEDDVAQRQQLRAWLGCAWPAVLDVAGKPFESGSWCAALAVIVDRCNGDLSRVKRLDEKGRLSADVRFPGGTLGSSRPPDPRSTLALTQQWRLRGLP